MLFLINAACNKRNNGNKKLLPFQVKAQPIEEALKLMRVSSISTIRNITSSVLFLLSN
jgi:hypothetical protein